MTNALAIDHLLLRLRSVNRALAREADRQTAAATRLDEAELATSCITDDHAAILLADVVQRASLSAADTAPGDDPLAPTRAERNQEDAYAKSASDAGGALPLHRLRETTGLAAFEEACVVTCAAPEIDQAYEGLFAYILDDVGRRSPCPELLCRMGARAAAEELALRPVIGPFGRLRCAGLLETFGDATVDRRANLRLAPGVMEFLLGAAPGSVGLWTNPDARPHRGTLDDVAARFRAQQLGEAIAGGVVSVVGVWGRSCGNPEQAAADVARAANRSLHRAMVHRVLDEPGVAMRTAREAVTAAAVDGAILEVRTDDLHDFPRQVIADWLASLLARAEVPVILVGEEPWRPTVLLAGRSYAELELESPDLTTRRAMWSNLLPEATPEHREDIAGRFRLSIDEVGAAARVARTQSALATNGHVVGVDETLDAAIATVARKTSGRYLNLVRPRRGPDDLILPLDLHRQVIEIADFTRALPRVAESWGFGRLATGGAGLKALFAGDPGTGKTLAAEVVAGLLAVPLLKVNLGQTVSKWLGETEKHLDEAFDEATANHALLFFDEADALFGKRGELRYGVDRYANTEVSHLLQKLETHEGLVILASNLKENIDPAFMRRFHVTIHFPRPTAPDRRRIWQVAFPAQAPLDQHVDLDSMAKLDLTGAGIVGAARTAAFLAADEPAPAITMAHIVRGVARQFRRESRVLKAAELGPHATLLEEPA